MTELDDARRDLIAEDVATAFERQFGGAPAVVVRAPGRVNLIGDHTDYNDGFALPLAIDRSTTIAARPRDDRMVHVLSQGFGAAVFDLESDDRPTGWEGYLAGTLWAVDAQRGWDAVISSDIPIGAGLSSSAALELAVARVVAAVEGRPWHPIDAAHAGQRVENEWLGANTGLMDQLTIALAEADSALLIDCRSLQIQLAPIPAEAAVVVLDTATRREVADSGYNERRAACERAAHALGVTALRDASLADLEVGELDAEDARRARHVISENARTIEAASALGAGGLERVGQLMAESHASMRDDFELSSPALDAIVDAAMGAPGCLGARITGGGFAGCGVALVERSALSAFLESAARDYEAATGVAGDLFEVRASAGVSLEVG